MSNENDALQQIANAILQGNSSLRRRIAKQQEQLAQCRCSDPDIADLVQMLGYDFLIETLDLEEEIFAAVYPDSGLGNNERIRLKKLVNEHYSTCSHCQLIADNHRWLDQQVDSLLAQEKAELNLILREEQGRSIGGPFVNVVHRPKKLMRRVTALISGGGFLAAGDK